MNKLITYIKANKIKSIVILILLLVYYFSLPKVLFDAPTATVVTTKNDKLIGAVIADDGQWRFPEIDSVPRKFKECILQFEDGHFYNHFGFNPISMGKAMVQNIKAKRVVRGGSTLTQQVIRLSRENTKRTYFEKFKELILATRLEFKYSKENILKLYASHAPFGGNVVGLEMASWRYFGLPAYQLSWSESATLAVLPNAPSLIYPGKNQERLKKKRNRLLKKIYEQDIIDSLTYQLALEEALPQKPYDLPLVAPHFVQHIAKEHKGERVQSSMDYFLQENVNGIVNQHYEVLKQNEVHNASVLVVDVKTRKVLSYIGNTLTGKGNQKDVDNVISGRSTGSVLKPILYAHMLQSGDLLPKQLVADIPTEIAGYNPKNFNLHFDGAVSANEALTRSLNIPAVRALKEYGLEKFRDDLKDYKISHITKGANHYGLPLILGGAEASLWDMCKVYAGFSGTINHYEDLSHQYYTNEFTDLSFLANDKVDFGTISNVASTIDAGSAYTTLEVLTDVKRPIQDQAWKYFDSSQKIAWKTGTSFGNRDAWAIGVTKDYVVGVWVGNSDGEGRPNLTGAGSASPILFDIFDVLPQSNWFLEPFEDLIEERICNTSGCLALPICESTKTRIPKNGIKGKTCEYHREIQLDNNGQYRVNADCEPIGNMKTKVWFELPPLQALYYKQNNSDYISIPNFREDCNKLEKSKMDFVFPTKYRSQITLTKGVSGELNPIILKLTHPKSEATVYWYVNKEYKQITNHYHQIAITPEKGTHYITVIDNFGNELKRILEVEYLLLMITLYLLLFTFILLET